MPCLLPWAPRVLVPGASCISAGAVSTLKKNFSAEQKTTDITVNLPLTHPKISTTISLELTIIQAKLFDQLLVLHVISPLSQVIFI